MNNMDWQRALQAGLFTAGSTLLGGYGNPQGAQIASQFTQNQQNLAQRIKEAEEYRQYRNRSLALEEQGLELRKEQLKAQKEQQSQWQAKDKYMKMMGEYVVNSGLEFTPETMEQIIPKYQAAFDKMGIPSNYQMEFFQSRRIYGDGQFHTIPVGKNKVAFVEVKPNLRGGFAKIHPYTEKGKLVTFGYDELDDADKVPAKLASIEKALKKPDLDPEEKQELLKRKELWTAVGDKLKPSVPIGQAEAAAKEFVSAFDAEFYGDIEISDKDLPKVRRAFIKDVVGRAKKMKVPGVTNKIAADQFDAMHGTPQKEMTEAEVIAEIRKWAEILAYSGKTKADPSLVYKLLFNKYSEYKQQFDNATAFNLAFSETHAALTGTQQDIMSLIDSMAAGQKEAAPPAAPKPPVMTPYNNPATRPRSPSPWWQGPGPEGVGPMRYR